MFNNNHKIENSNIKLLKQVNNNKYLDAYESILIHKFKNNIMNSDLGPIPISKLFDLFRRDISFQIFCLPRI